MSSSVSTGKVEKPKEEEEEFPHAAAADDIEKGSSPAYGSNSNTTAELEPDKNVQFERNKRLKQARARVRSRQRVLHRVPPQMRQQNKRVYEPQIMSLTPYNHHQCHSPSMEEFKDEVVRIICSADEQSVLRLKILSRVNEIRRFYEGISQDEYDDQTLTDMILRNSCVVVYLMDGNREMIDHAFRFIGFFKLSLVFDDYLKLENQIPWWVIRYLIKLIHNDDDDDDENDDGDDDDGIRLKHGGRTFISRYLNLLIIGGYNKLDRVRWTNKEYFHLLEVIRRFMLKDDIDSTIDHRNMKWCCPHLMFKCACKFRCWRKQSRPISVFEKIKRPFRSATELQAKGIHFRPSSCFLNDIRFDSYLFQGVLYLPALIVERNTVTLFLNMIALEASPGANRDGAVTSYVNFMKSLIQNPGDVKILREKGIFFDYLGDNEQIVGLFKEIDTYGLDNYTIFQDIKQSIDQHCNSKAKTWMAELIHTYFRTPWTALALIAATFLLCLTFLQTYYTMNPKKSGN